MTRAHYPTQLHYAGIQLGYGNFTAGLWRQYIVTVTIVKYDSFKHCCVDVHETF